MRKQCKSCNKNRDVKFFFKHKHSKDGLQQMCKSCKRDLDARIREEKKDGTYVSKCRNPRLTEEDRIQRKLDAKKYQKEYRRKNKDAIRKGKRENRRAVRLEGIKEYGGKCSCCGEDQVEFLTVEHLNGRDGESVKKTSYKVWSSLKRQGWPKEGYTVLCFNCNCAKGIYGVCPHLMV